MSEIAKAKELQNMIASINKEMERLKNDGNLNKKLAELEKIKEIMIENDITSEDMASFFGLNTSAKSRKRVRREAPKSEWTNPHTGEIYVGIRRAGKLKDWIDEYGFEEVESWKKVL